MVSIERKEWEESSPFDRVVRLKATIDEIYRGPMPILSGCIRRNLWTQNQKPTSFHVHRKGILSAIATEVEITTPIGKYAAWLFDRTLIEVFGGDYRGWWEDDMMINWVIAKKFTGMSLPNHTYIIQLIKGDVNVYSPPVSREPIKDETVDIISNMQIQRAAADPPGRIAKNQQRAYIVCRRCPVKRECDTADSLQPQGKEDWGRNYPFP